MPEPSVQNPAPAVTAPVLCFGEILWDSLPQGLFPGGAPVNVAYHLQRLGLRPVPVTAVGGDFLGDELLRRLKRWGLPADGVTVCRDLPTGAVLVELDASGVPRFTILENVAWDRIEPNAAVESLAPTAAAVIYGTLAQRGEHNRQRLGRLLDRAARALRIFDVNLRPPFDRREVVWPLAARAQVIKLNHDELRTLLGGRPASGQLEAAARAFATKAGCGTICVTAGPRGAGLLLDGQWHWADARPVAVKDTVGSGDAFLASLTRSLLLRDAPPRLMLERACRLAEFVATQDGAMPAYAVSPDGSVTAS